MNFIDRVKTGRLFAGWWKNTEQEETKVKIPKTFVPTPQEESKTGKPQIVTEKSLEEVSTVFMEEKKQVGPDMIIHFVFMEKTYIVEKFNLNFRQDIDPRKNRPDSFTYGGVMQITISEAPDYSINEWMVQTYMMRSGEIRFFSNMPKITNSSLLTIFFSDAYCVAYDKKANTKSGGLLTTLTISPRTIKIGGEEFENNWKKKETLSHTIKSE
ncbi:hypothetical protein FACS189426_01970 [Bacteroidia bacterium]|nr:hypothetical protein FACS189426_01970 [Bacteroidia bacterium]